MYVWVCSREIFVAHVKACWKTYTTMKHRTTQTKHMTWPVDLSQASSSTILEHTSKYKKGQGDIYRDCLGTKQHELLLAIAVS